MSAMTGAGKSRAWFGAVSRATFRWLMATTTVVGVLALSAAPAYADGQSIVNAAQAMQNAGYPYGFDGGNPNGPTVGTGDPASDGSYSNCSQIGKVGYDCTGLTLYAVYQGTGNATLSHDGYQAKSGGGQVISSQADLRGCPGRRGTSVTAVPV